MCAHAWCIKNPTRGANTLTIRAPLPSIVVDVQLHFILLRQKKKKNTQLCNGYICFQCISVCGSKWDFQFFFSLIDIGHGCSAPTGLVCTSAAALCPSLFVLQVSDLQPSLPLAQVFLWPHPAAPPAPSPSLPPASPLPLRCGNTISLCCRTTTTDTSGTTRKHGVQSGSGFRGKSGSGAGGWRGARRS